MAMDFEDFMVEVHGEIEGFCLDEGYDISSEDMETLMAHLYDEGMDYMHLDPVSCAKKLIKNFTDIVYGLSVA